MTNPKITPEYLAELRKLADRIETLETMMPHRCDLCGHWEERDGNYICRDRGSFTARWDGCSRWQLKGDQMTTMRIQSPALEAVDRWVPVAERLPERDCRVLIAVKYSHEKGFTFSDVGYLSSFGKWHYVEDDEHEIFQSDVTHWRELPLPPTKEVK